MIEPNIKKSRIDLYRIILFAALIGSFTFYPLITVPPEILLTPFTGQLDWAQDRFNSPRLQSIKPKDEGVERVAYISNSHGMTGGRISRHLQRLLDQVFPGSYEVIDLTSGGMFTPEYQQKLSAALKQSF